jgi:hypothetical protein
MRILCHAFTKHGQAVKAALVEDQSTFVPFTLYALESDEILPFDIIGRVVPICDMDKPATEFTVSDFHDTLRRGQQTIGQFTWSRIVRKLNPHGIDVPARD